MQSELPLRCAMVRGALVVKIGSSVLKFATENHPELWDGEKDAPAFRVTDTKCFAMEVVRELNEEGEDGSTLISRMLDAAVLRAIENGAEGVKDVSQ